ncbi:MAG: DUF2490 domain-containing protein [Bacteroidales bacterium]|jgi:hypothetical protein|nr:DUF2490 domain-containing protein [Bacteroidales bacterium]MDD2204623.1 DUF2490 domain-containing protein [Bacteroidales bacterium]MDD3152199.1 DUF2490 domain-containing protein [Bacteroidales bacterium]MDD3913702.1 DUF2490 domain-containing protein [Bacteroidales bacterium]MDD4633953.1 DUF2490 domain-containing protein [Bacteroidales bacterium]
MTKHFVTIILASTILCALHAQSFDIGGIAGVDYNRDIGNSFNISLEEEIKFSNYFSNYDRFKSGISIDYSHPKYDKFKIGVGADYLNKNETEYYDSRFRWNATFSYSEKYRQYKFSYRARFQSTYRDENRGDYKLNPKNYLRNRLEVGYTFYTKPIKLALSTELFLRLNNPEGNFIDNIRTTFEVNYRFTRRSSMSFFVRSDNEIQVKNPLNAVYAGVVYKFSDK